MTSHVDTTTGRPEAYSHELIEELVDALGLDTGRWFCVEMTNHANGEWTVRVRERGTGWVNDIPVRRGIE